MTKVYPINMYVFVLFACIINSYRVPEIDMSILFKFAPLPLWQSHACPNGTPGILNHMTNFGCYQPTTNTTKRGNSGNLIKWNHYPTQCSYDITFSCVSWCAGNTIWWMCAFKSKLGTQQNPWSRHQMETFSALLAICEGIHRSPMNSPYKGQWREDLMFSLICAWINERVNNRKTGVLRCHHVHYDVILMVIIIVWLKRTWLPWI